MILERLVVLLTDKYPNRGMKLEPGHVRPDDRPDIFFPAAHAHVGDLVIADEGDEATVFVGRITHGHFGCYEEGLRPEDRERWVADQVADFVSALFEDRVLLWSALGAGGWEVRNDIVVDAPASWLGIRSWFVWSRPLRITAAGQQSTDE